MVPADAPVKPPQHPPSWNMAGRRERENTEKTVYWPLRACIAPVRPGGIPKSGLCRRTGIFATRLNLTLAFALVLNHASRMLTPGKRGAAFRAAFVPNDRPETEKTTYCATPAQITDSPDFSSPSKAGKKGGRHPRTGKEKSP
jgi:hypothetical protein